MLLKYRVQKHLIDNMLLPMTYLMYYYRKLIEIRKILNVLSPKTNRIGNLDFRQEKFSFSFRMQRYLQQTNAQNILTNCFFFF